MSFSASEKCTVRPTGGRMKTNCAWLRVRTDTGHVPDNFASREAPLRPNFGPKLGYHPFADGISFCGFLGSDRHYRRRENRQRRHILVLLRHHGDHRRLRRLLAGHRGGTSDNHILDHARRHRSFYDNYRQGSATGFRQMEKTVAWTSKLPKFDRSYRHSGVAWLPHPADGGSYSRRARRT